jgi:hypothetical protein
MGFLTRLLKTPGDDQEEGQDEFHAEESGLLMVPSLPTDKQETTPADPAPQDEASLTQDEGTQILPVQSQPQELTEEPPATQDQASQPTSEKAEAEQDPSSDPLSLFRTTAAKQLCLSPALLESVEDVSAADLLAEARSIRDSLLGRRTMVSGARRKQEAA